MKTLRPSIFWIFAFIYSAIAALVLQKLVLPMIPSLHGGHGLLMNDAMVFHDAAVQLAERIHAEGWAAWRLFPAPGMTGNVGLLGALYAAFGVEPALFIPFSAAAHALAGTLIYMLGMAIWPGRVGSVGGLIAGVLFVCFPSSLQWHGQNHKDTFAIAGTLMLIYALVSMREQALAQKRAWVQGIAICFVGAELVALVRPYFLMLLVLGLLPATFVWSLCAWGRARHTVRNSVGYSLALLSAVSLVLVLAPSDRDLVNGEQMSAAGLASALGSDAADMATLLSWQWQPSVYLPPKIDHLLERVSAQRLNFIVHGIAVGATSGIDSDRAPSSASELIAYLPRAAMVGLFAPFPATWVEKQTLPRLIGAVETCIFYLASIGMLGLLSRQVMTRNMAAAGLFALTLITVLAYAHPNVGTLYRQRYGLWFVFMLFGCVGWVALGQRLWGAIKPAVPEQNRNRKSLPQLAFTGAVLVLISAISYLGFVVRDLILVKNHGVSGQLDGFFIAAMLPMFWVAALSLPLSDAMTAKFMALDGQRDLQSAFARSLLSVVSVILAVVAAALLIFAEPLIRLAGGIASSVAASDAALMLRMFLPILVFAAWTAVGNAILNALHHSRVVAVGQAIVPLTTVLVLLIYGDALGVKAAIYGMVLGFAINIAVLAAATYQVGIVLLPAWPDWRLISTSFTKYHRLCLIALLTAAIGPLNYYFASQLEPGSVTTWALGSKMVQLVTGFAAIVIGSVFLPHFAQLHRQQEKNRLGQDMYFLLLSGTWLALLIAVLTQVFADPLVLAIFQSSDVAPDAALRLAAILRLGSLQLPFVIATTLAIKFVAAAGLTGRPVLAAILGLLLNVVFNLLWVERYGVLGLTTAMVVASAAPAICLVCLIRVQCAMTVKQIGGLFGLWLSLGLLTTAMNLANPQGELLAIALLCAIAFWQWRQLIGKKTHKVVGG